ncbi:hypothetical protein Zm00014a_000908 [Zea mays]|uniref:Uncharacterized protein n=1 Tax=Zea mays TaxID=4577 RepID=A0A317Y2D3_MAIZE|nr:hypothetical protein Zm00014a_000908 [Zea mays]
MSHAILISFRCSILPQSQNSSYSRFSRSQPFLTLIKYTQKILLPPFFFICRVLVQK